MTRTSLGVRRRAAACALGVVLGGLTAVPASANHPTPMDDAVRNAAPELRRCLTRNDDVVGWREHGDLPAMRNWHKQHRQGAHKRTIAADYKRLGIEHESADRRASDRVTHGLLGYDLDPVNSRLIMIVDPEIVPIVEFRRWVEATAARASEAAGVEGRPLGVTVQKGCFTAERIDRFKRFLDRHHRWDARDNNVNLANRIVVGVCGKDDRAWAERVQRRVGPVMQIEGACVRLV